MSRATTKSEPKAQSAAVVEAPSLVTRKFRGESEFTTDLFKTTVGLMQRNMAIRKGVVNLTELEHTHIFRTFDSRGRPQQYTSTTGGHFHEVIVDKSASGEITLRCGPAMQTVLKKGPEGAKRKVQQVRWLKGNPDDEDNREWVADKHKHEFVYQYSETLSEKQVNEMQAGTRAAVGGMIAGEKPRITSPDNLNANDGVSLSTED